ncbi:ATP-dependent RNA helicase DBP4 [Astathelohania contejeani]|uniref:ATP-dependent RNA helicase n=1 Tax=Astathelohania contejeani TaxID=164912 RepID=A0ABQ7I1Z2_9MICR|nr:ATP-dependent RNA helicase DBP4 [Thelohania contejeani]
MNFEDLKVDKKILKALKKINYNTPTEIQSAVIPLAIEGNDIIGSSKTGSGKTLAFIVPVINRLLNVKWSRSDGLGALVLTPTRELALQILKETKRVGEYAPFNVGLAIGGVQEKHEIAKMNIIIATPGRMLQHFQESYKLNGDSLQILVLDEADKMVEMGFKEDLELLLGYLSNERQVLLFSATPNAITRKIECLNLNEPKIVSIYKQQNEFAPSGLSQFYYSVSLIDKIPYLYSLLSFHKNRKTMVFFATCKETKFYFLLFSQLKLRNKIYFLSGGLKQEQRIKAYNGFLKEKGGALFCTDVGSRGLDFPGVDLIIQFDCPDTVLTYVHRIGRTARNNGVGTSIIFLLKGEEKILDDLAKGKWANEGGNSKLQLQSGHPEKGKELQVKSIDKWIQKLIDNSEELKEFAEKYIKTYTRFLELNKKKYFGKSIDEIEDLKHYLNVKSINDKKRKIDDEKTNKKNK